MGLGDLFKAKQNDELRARVAQLEAMLTPEMRDSLTLQSYIENQKMQLTAMQNNLNAFQEQTSREMQKKQREIEKQESVLRDVEDKIAQARSALIETEEEVLMQSFGLYKPKFSFSNSTGYKDELSKIRQQQKDMIKNGRAVTGNTNWTVNGSVKDGKKMVADMQKLLLRAFNCECDDVIEHAKFNNIEVCEKRIRTARDTISKLAVTYGVEITAAYLALKIKELYLSYEFQLEKQKEKEELRQLRAEERERAKLEKEIEAERKKIEKEQKHYTNALKKLEEQMASASPEELVELEKKKSELEGVLSELDKSMVQIDYRAANQKAGYVYVISNLGAFGENVYKIGMTRRLDPMDRIDELGDASVPFDFDVHAMIFSENAPALEAALHQAFEDRKLNMVNTRREFFKVSLDEIKKVVRENYDKTVEFIDVPPAEQFRQSKLIREQK